MAEATDTPTDDTPQDTSDGDGKTPGGGQSGADTDTAKNPADGKKYTEAEMKAEAAKLSDKSFAKRMRAELVKRGIDPDTDKPTATVEELQRKAEDAESRARTLEAKDDLFDFVDDPKNKVNLKPESRKAFWRLAKEMLEYDDDGKATNLKEVSAAIKDEVSALFVTTKGSVDAGARGVTADVVDMNAAIRRAAGRQ